MYQEFICKMKIESWCNENELTTNNTIHNCDRIRITMKKVDYNVKLDPNDRTYVNKMKREVKN